MANSGAEESADMEGRQAVEDGTVQTLLEMEEVPGSLVRVGYVGNGKEVPCA